MAKRIIKPTLSKQSAATRRTKKKPTPVKKAPSKSNLVISGNPVKQKTSKMGKKRPIVVNNTVTSGNLEPKKIPKVIMNKPSDFVKIASNAKTDEFTVLGERVKRGEIRWAYFTVEGDVGYHYYRILIKL